MNKIKGNSVRGSSTGRPIMVLLDVLGRRWVLRILWELSSSRANFRTLRKRCDDASPTILNKRLKELRELQLVDLNEQGYGLTDMGNELAQQFTKLHLWAENWAKNVDG